MYRGITAKALDRGIDPVNEEFAVVQLARGCRIKFDWEKDPPRLYINSVDVTDRLRDSDVSKYVSEVASIRGVRQVLVEAQREIGQEHARLVSEGRDQGSVVFPDADIKFYLDASPSVRAERRVAQIRHLGRSADPKQIRKDILARDHKDSIRRDGPMICPEDAQKIDTSDMTLDEVVDLLEQRVWDYLQINEE